MGKARNGRAKRIREGGLDPTIARGTWLRKPQTQVVPNKKAESRRAACRRWQGRGDFLPCKRPIDEEAFSSRRGKRKPRSKDGRTPLSVG